VALVEDGGDNADYPRIDMTHLSFPQAVFSGFFICALLYMAFNSFRVNLYVASVQSRMNFLTSQTQVYKGWTEAFGFVLPISQILTVNMVGRILDTQPRWRIMLILNSLILIMGVSMVVPNLYVQALTFFVDGVITGMLFGALSSYIMDIFGVENFGKLWGLCYLVDGCMSLFVIGPSIGFTLGTLKGNWRDYDLGCLGLIVVSFGFPFWLRYRQMGQADYNRRKASQALLGESETTGYIAGGGTHGTFDL
jgi:predicted membrane channel-forming protein YqfA (hemolysin III family)